MRYNWQNHNIQNIQLKWRFGKHTHCERIPSTELFNIFTTSHIPSLSLFFFFLVRTLQFSSVAQSCPTLCDPMNCSTPGLPIHHHLPEFSQTHIHRVGDAIQPSHFLSSRFPPAPNPSQHQSFPMSQLFAWGAQNSSSIILATFNHKIQY